MKTTQTKLRRIIQNVLLEARAIRDLRYKTPSGGEIRIAEFDGEGESIRGEWNPTWEYDLDLIQPDGWTTRKRGLNVFPDKWIKEFWSELEGGDIEFHNDDIYVVDTQEYLKPL